MNLETIIRYVISLLLLLGVYATSGLVWEEIKTGNGCPKIWTIPACVVILICFLIPLLTHLFKKYNTLYFVFTGLAFVIAVIASLMQFTGNGECPKLDNGTPMCYLSLITFFSLISLKKIQIKFNNKN